jgi:large subunit ribosomal protein L21e|tara:strand:+ start:713 stop:1003 length:291 start_codon:yes stop_codon:yes gene_type:complete
MRRSKGSRSKSRYKMKKPIRKRGKLPVSKLIQEFKVNDTVSIVNEPSIQKGQPHPRFHGKTGIVVEKRGRSYLVQISDGKTNKKIISRPVHLVLQR